MKTALDNPAWWALDSYHASFAVGIDLAKRYQPGILPFAACHPVSQDSMAALDPLIKAGESFYLIGELAPLPAGWMIEREIPCAQMIGPPAITAPEDVPIYPLGEADKEEMYELITGVQPGYYNRDTFRLGTYYGIRINGKLVAMAGERLRLNGYTELSAICTHPEYRGQQYAQQLIVRLCRLHYATGITPILHVATSNERAIRLYEYMGFTHRRQITFWCIRKMDSIY
jgi:GNAT superfamily N-acetyltransferase